jgi:hypothetical protein
MHGPAAWSACRWSMYVRAAHNHEHSTASRFDEVLRHKPHLGPRLSSLDEPVSDTLAAMRDAGNGRLLGISPLDLLIEEGHEPFHVIPSEGLKCSPDDRHVLRHC